MCNLIHLCSKKSVNTELKNQFVIIILNDFFFDYFQIFLMALPSPRQRDVQQFFSEHRINLSFIL